MRIRNQLFTMVLCFLLILVGCGDGSSSSSSTTDDIDSETEIITDTSEDEDEDIPHFVADLVDGEGTYTINDDPVITVIVEKTETPGKYLLNFSNLTKVDMFYFKATEEYQISISNDEKSLFNYYLNSGRNGIHVKSNKVWNYYISSDDTDNITELMYDIGIDYSDDDS